MVAAINGSEPLARFDMANKIVRSGMQIYCDRKNELREESRRRADAVVDTNWVKFYETLEAYREKAEAEGRKPRPMFKVEVLHPDENGAVKTLTLEYGVLCPEQLKIAQKVAESFAPLSPTRGRRRKEDGTEAAGEDEAAEAAPAQAAAAA